MEGTSAGKEKYNEIHKGCSDYKTDGNTTSDKLEYQKRPINNAHNLNLNGDEKE